MSETPAKYEVDKKAEPAPVQPDAPVKPASSMWGFVAVALAGIAIGGGALFLLKSPSVTILPASASISIDGARVVVVDAPRLIQAALVAQMLKKQHGLDGDEIGKVVAATVTKYQREGYIVMAAAATVGYPPSADITAEIAAELSIDLNDAEKGERMLSGEDEHESIE